MAQNQSGDETAAGSAEDQNIVIPENPDDNDIRSLLEREYDEPSSQRNDSPEDAADTSKVGAESPTASEEPAPPQSWTEEERKAWAELPETVRDAIQRTETAQAQAIRSDAELQKVLAPVVEQLEGTGKHVDEYVGNLLRADEAIRTNPLAVIQQIAQRHGLDGDLSKIYGGNDANQQTQSNEQPAHDPRVDELEWKVAYNDATAEWNALAASRPEAEQYRELVAGQIAANPALTFEGALDKVLKTVGVTPGQQTDAEREAAAIDANTQAAGKAQRLNLPRGRAGEQTEPDSTGSLRGDLERAYARVNKA